MGGLANLHMISTVTKFGYRFIELEGVSRKSWDIDPAKSDLTGFPDSSKRLMLYFFSTLDANVANSYSLFRMDPDTGSISKCDWKEITVGDRLYVFVRSNFAINTAILIK